jgi:serine acetyltransferase
MNTRTLLTIVATTAAIAIMTSSIGIGIFLQHANAAVIRNDKNCNVNDQNCRVTSTSSLNSINQANSIQTLEHGKQQQK